MRLSIFWRLALGSLAIIVVVAGVNFYAINQLRMLTALSTELVSFQYPAIEAAKRLLTGLYAQLRNEKKYLAVRDAVFLRDFDDEAGEFQASLASLLDQETDQNGRQLLTNLGKLHEEYRALVHRYVAEPAQPSSATARDYEGQRDALFMKMTEILGSSVRLHEARVSTLVSDSQARSARAEAVTQQLVLLAILLGLALAGIASYSILHPLRRLQEHIRQIGQGRFGPSVEVVAPRDLQELVDTVNWMGKKLQELDDLKAEFLAHISHELRTPLASIREGTRLLLDEIPGPLTQAQRETLQIMTDSGERLIRLISTLLDLSKMEAGMMDYRIVPADLMRVVEAAVNKLRLLAERKQVKILTEAPKERLWVLADGAWIEQVLDNLFSNALKFSAAGAAVTLRLQPDPQGGVVRVSVSDTGQGIAPEDLPHIFERFYQGRRQAKTAVAGSGLGLALVKKVVEAHGGQVRVESELGKGTTFQFSLPLTKPGGSA